MQRSQATRSALTGMRLFRVAVLTACLLIASAQIALSASPIQQLTTGAAADVRPAWSLDGTRVAFQSNRGKLYQVYVMDAGGANQLLVSAEGSDDRHPSWSPSGTHLAVDSGSEVTREIWTIDVASGARTQVSRLGSIATFPSWSPDGTRLSFYAYKSSLNFAQGIPHFAISIALRSEGAFRVGVVYDPCRDELFQATVDGPALLNGQVVFVQQISEGLEAFAKAIVGTDWPYSGERRELAVRMMSLFSEQVTECNTMGSPALGPCYVAAGRLHAYWHLDLKIWDVAAASLILQRAGGTLTDADGVTWLYSNGGYIGSNSIIHGWTLRTITAVLMQPKPPVPRDHDRGAHPPS